MLTSRKVRRNTKRLPFQKQVPRNDRPAIALSAVLVVLALFYPFFGTVYASENRIEMMVDQVIEVIDTIDGKNNFTPGIDQGDTLAEKIVIAFSANTSSEGILMPLPPPPPPPRRQGQ